MNSQYNFTSIWGFKVFNDKLSKIPIQGVKNRVLCCSISPNNYGMTVKDAHFKDTLQKTDFLVLDGVYFALASIFLMGKNIKRNQGPDVYKHFIQRMEATSGKVFFLGSSEEVLGKIRDRMKIEYPNVTVGTYSPPYKPVFSDEDNQKMIDTINEFEPNIVFVGMTAPKQEKWSVQHREQLNTNLTVCIGAVFDWFAGTEKEIHPFFFRIRLGWLFRILYRPEIFKRNMGNQVVFFWHLLLVMLRLKQQPA
ncbi:WecB/TagA/CpsF family glycosyltransferase [Dyadobacter luticola]|uniref:WecB/TagA/CpsF family glycosyltransferase n=1 Tax=Dyadobacter luticola TaxID=1979387 RepID=A0A5R9L5J8_9BACT|nr:WecB/TagA/CpsF family glycosyltransferase [Dyadobacter luticola]TLV03718.1 WecB/TagA/CpsF family glycosyltransferase [Dyadobacter luticola]